MVKKKKGTEEIEAIPEPVVLESASESELQAVLEEIKTYDGVIGYILRNSTSATIDLKDPSKIIDYAIISSSAIDACHQLTKLFELGEVKEIVIEGKEARVLSSTVDENKIGVFMEKGADLNRVRQKLRSS